MQKNICFRVNVYNCTHETLTVKRLTRKIRIILQLGEQSENNTNRDIFFIYNFGICTKGDIRIRIRIRIRISLFRNKKRSDLIISINI